jgi:hypothetical protein
MAPRRSMMANNKPSEWLKGRFNVECYDADWNLLPDHGFRAASLDDLWSFLVCWQSAKVDGALLVDDMNKWWYKVEAVGLEVFHGR